LPPFVVRRSISATTIGAASIQAQRYGVM
jgi:hypothetical protein